MIYDHYNKIFQAVSLKKKNIFIQFKSLLEHKLWASRKKKQ